MSALGQSGHFTLREPCPLYPRKWALIDCSGMSNTHAGNRLARLKGTQRHGF